MKKFEHLGKNLSKEEMKLVQGGADDELIDLTQAACVECGGTKGTMCGDGNKCVAGDRTLTCQDKSGTHIYVC